MNSFRITIFLLVAAALFFLPGCASDEDSGSSGENQTSSVAGTATDEAGTAVKGARVIAMERQGNQKYSTQTGDDGTYLLPLPEGVYDLAVDDGQARSTYFTGPIVLDGTATVEQNAEIPAGGSGDETVSGTIVDRNVADLSGWKVEFVSSMTQAGEDRVLATAALDSAGAFTASVGGERAMDVNVLDRDGNLVEFFDFAKLPGACRLNLAVGSGTPNRYRHDEEAGDHTHEEALTAPTSATSSAFAPSYSGSDQQVKHVFLSSHTNDAFDFSHSWTDDGEAGQSFYEFVLENGELGVNGGRLLMTRNTWPGFDSDHGFALVVAVHDRDKLEFDIEVKDDGSWWYTYAVHDYARNIGGFGAGFTFEDETKDTYNLTVSGDWGWHTVSYNSDKPTIKYITMTDPYADFPKGSDPE